MKVIDSNLLLKNSIEAGASLEALAKGEVKFSRGLTIHELQDQRTSLLYDRVVSTQASARMVKVEPSGFNPLSKVCKLDDLKGNGKITEKRKAGSICVQYYGMRKRIKDELHYSPGVSFFDKCNSSSTVTDCEYADHLDSVLNISNEDDLLCTLNTEKTIDDIPNSPLLDSSENVVEDPLCNPDATAMLVATPSIQCHEEVQRFLFDGDQQDVCQWEADYALTSISHLDSVQLNEGKVICILNTEESEIPCNDDIFFLIYPSPSVIPQIAKKSIDPLPSFADENFDEQGLSAAKYPAPYFTRPQMDGPDLSSEFDSIHPHAGYTFKSDSADTKCLHPLSGQPDMSSSAGHSRLMHINPLPTGNRVLAKNGLDTSATYSELSLRTEVRSFKMIDPELMDNNPSLSDHNNSDSDGNLHYFSDIEALILRLDLEYAQGACITSEACMVKVEPSGFNSLSAISRLDDLKGNKKTREKRKGGSIRIQYYRKRKRIKDDLFHSPDLRFFEKFNKFQDRVTLNHEAQVSDAMSSESLANRLRFEETDFEITCQAFPETIRSFATTDVDRLTIDLTGSYDPNFELKDDSASSSTVTEGDILCGLNTEDTMDDISDSQLLNSPENVLEDSLCIADGATLLVATPRIECDEESKDSSFHDDQQNVCHWEADVALTSTTHLDSIQLSDGKVICVLNTEDSEIPRNDDIFMHIHQSSVRPQIITDFIDPLFSSADLYYEFDSAQPHIGYTFRSESFDTKCLHPRFGQPDNITNPVLIGDRVLTRDGLDTSATYSDMSLRTEVKSLKKIYPESMDNYLSISDHNNSESDDDLPCFSDIEALIHRMDLEYAEKSYITSEVGRHQYNYSKRTITRLEQTSLSSLHRAMSSLGALAVFYSRHFTCYIKKTEVVIGRSTKDADVDIDLRKVGRANMISRTQATIKMEIDGSFTLTNLGRSSISMNGNSVAHGQVAALSSSCLIEIITGNLNTNSTLTMKRNSKTIRGRPLSNSGIRAGNDIKEKVGNGMGTGNRFQILGGSSGFGKNQTQDSLERIADNFAFMNLREGDGSIFTLEKKPAKISKRENLRLKNTME